MSILSWEFLCLILIGFVAFHLVKKNRFIVLTIISCCFYAFYGFLSALILIFLTGFIFCLGIFIQREKEKKLLEENEQKKSKQKQLALLWVGIFGVILSIVLTRVVGRTKIDFNFSSVAESLVAVGISFYGLRLVSYLVDLYLNKFSAEKNPIKLLLFSSLFLTVLQGPFFRYTDFFKQIEAIDEKRIDWQTIEKSSFRILFGVIKKMCIANQLALVVGRFYASPEMFGGASAFFVALLFAIELYADFSGYMDIMIGVSKLFFVELPENFKQPFFSSNIVEFWRRWHITLGEFLKDYVYYPLMRLKFVKKLDEKCPIVLKKNKLYFSSLVSMFVMWVVIGLWHGFNFNFVFGVGILQFVYIVLYLVLLPLLKLVNKKLKIEDGNKIVKILGCVSVFLMMSFAWIFFRSPDTKTAFVVVSRLFQKCDLSVEIPILIGNAKILNYSIFILLSLGVLFVVDFLKEKNKDVLNGIIKFPYISKMILFVLMIFCVIVFGVYGGDYVASNFIYLNF